MWRETQRIHCLDTWNGKEGRSIFRYRRTGHTRERERNPLGVSSPFSLPDLPPTVPVSGSFFCCPSPSKASFKLFGGEWKGKKLNRVTPISIPLSN